MSRYTVIIERGSGPNSFGAYVPDLPGCVAVGKSVAQVEKRIAGAIGLHLEGMREDGLPIPKPSSSATVVDVRPAPRMASHRSRPRAR
jgi:predicted RNase H-like HicB family nuclease